MQFALVELRLEAAEPSFALRLSAAARGLPVVVALAEAVPEVGVPVPSAPPAQALESGKEMKGPE